MTAAGTDAIAALRWGLRRYGVVLLLCMVLGGSLAPAALRWFEAPVEAEALLIAQRLDMDLVALPRYGEAVFTNGAVEQAIGARFGDLGDSEEIIPDRVSLLATQDSIVFQVVGRDADPQVAADIANTATDAFIEALNTGGVGVGTFALQSRATAPPESDSQQSLIVAVVAGLAAGALLGLAFIGLLLIIRRPIVSPEDASEATGVSTIGTVDIPRARKGATVPPEAFAGVIPVCRRLLALPTSTVLLVSRHREERARHLLATALTEVLGRVREVRYVDGLAVPGAMQRASGLSGTQRPPVTVVDGDESFSLKQPSDATVDVLVAPEGISSAALRAAVVQHLGGSAEARIVLVRPGRRRRDGETSSDSGSRDVPPRETLPVSDRA